VLKRCIDPDLAQEAVCREPLGDLGLQELDCDAAVVLEIVRREYARIAPFADLRFQHIASGESIVRLRRPSSLRHHPPL
jgi:hypothetical protein